MQLHSELLIYAFVSSYRNTEINNNSLIDQNRENDTINHQANDEKIHEESLDSTHTIREETQILSVCFNLLQITDYQQIS